MREAACRAPVPFETLIEYWLGEFPPAETERIDEHIILCGTCSAALGKIVALSEGIRAVFRKGDIHVILTPDSLNYLVGQGVRVRQYRCSRNGSVACSVGPADDLLVGRLEVPLADVTRLDAFSRRSCEDAEHRLSDIPFDAPSNEVVVAPNLMRTRLLPSHRHIVRLVAVEGEAERFLGEYTFYHSAHD
jgi:hypothetical protein